MRILVVGSGAREHALCWKLAQEADVFITPGNGGTAQFGIFSIPSSDADGLIELAQSLRTDLVVFGPEDPLIFGLADRLRAAGLAVFGPGASGARLEASKAFSKELMLRSGVPTARSQTFTSFVAARDYTRERFAEGAQVAIKASGAALGKGVAVCGLLEEAEEALEQMLVSKEFGEAGETVLVEDRLFGREFSLMSLVSGTQVWSLPIAQDYKRALDGDRGPNTGGMGSCSPVAWVSDDLIQRTEREVVHPLLQEAAQAGIEYRGVLFSGLLVQEGQVFCLEYNVRFGDPETQTLMLRLGSGFANALSEIANGNAPTPVEVLENAAVSVVLASGGYPGGYETGKPIAIEPMPVGIEVFHAGTRLESGALVTSGGRVMSVSASASDLQAARNLAYEAVGKVRFDGCHYRKDIGN